MYIQNKSDIVLGWPFGLYQIHTFEIPFQALCKKLNNAEFKFVSTLNYASTYFILCNLPCLFFLLLCHEYCRRIHILCSVRNCVT